MENLKKDFVDAEFQQSCCYGSDYRLCVVQSVRLKRISSRRSNKFSMTHARESLETFLGEPSHDGSGGRLSDRNVVSQIFPEIETYRQRGYSLSAIHSALVRGGDLSCTITTFRTYYYQERHQRSDEQSLPEQGSTTDLAVPMTEPLPLQDAEEQISTDTSDSTSLLTISDTELKAQQALAKRMFAQRRAELGITRREN